jgi:hypothetical protein
VTGTFDNWTKSVKLEKQGDVFQKTVDLTIPTDTNKIQYKVGDSSLQCRVLSQLSRLRPRCLCSPMLDLYRGDVPSCWRGLT